MKTNISGKQQKNAKIHSKKRKMTPNNDFLDNLANDQHQKMLREIANDDLTPKKHNFKAQKEIHEKIRNDDDYDDWDYGTEPIVLTEF